MIIFFSYKFIHTLLNFFFANINRPLLHFHISFWKILSDNAHTEKLYSADQTQNTDHGRPAWSRISEDQRFSNDHQDHQKCQHTEQNTQNGCKSKRHRRKCHNSFERINKQFPERPLGLPLFTFYVFKLKPFCPKTYPAINAFGKAVVFFNR